MKKIVVIGIVIITAALILPWLLRMWVDWLVRERVFTSPEAAPANHVALVLGAGLRRDGFPTPILYDRVVTAVDLYQAGTVNKLLMSGDNRYDWYNEPEAMRQLARRLGVPDEDIVLDYAGRRTYDSCYRAKEIFELQAVTVVTQQFHLNRALYLCQSLGLEAVGVVADRRAYRAPSIQWWELRELAALVNAWLDVHLLRPQPVLGERLPIETAGL